MFKLLHNNRGQGITIQYALTFFFIVGAVTAMTVYFKRAVQGRIRDASIYMANTVHNAYGGPMYAQYEPYYTEVTIDRVFDSSQFDQLGSSFNLSSGVFTGSGTTITITNSFTNQRPPAVADD